MNARVFTLLVLLLAALAAGCVQNGEPRGPVENRTATGTPDPDVPTMELTSDAFGNGSLIPPRYTCDGEDVSPAISWSGVPREAVGLALTVQDPDAPGGDFTHWIVYNISPGQRGLDAALPNLHELPGGARQGTNSFGTVGYSGPCPPAGTAHRYVFSLYALDTDLRISGPIDPAALEQEIEGHIIAEGVLIGMYRR
ncbi:hypothetical protein ASZ90_010391 [hydrocarbon metagenome]|uniref:Phospholipid-binding protein n=1 Tax=hydrocarbon metagenome TaxID=938273 RepID=A0A0W8FGK6_9ZZZZ|nr:YbhB/YbcL family Raf kinase inhibitor-like protein [Methanomicrobiaceae archaeon]